MFTAFRTEIQKINACGTTSSIASVVAAAAIFLAAGLSTSAADDVASGPDSTCLGCHGSPGLEKKLGNGESLPLTIDAAVFAKSVHSVMGCQSCHADVDLGMHPPADKKIAGKREFSVASAEICRGCHSDKFEQWESSIHASLVRDGNPAAPVCTDCHQPHAVIKGAAETFAAVPCRTCHASILEAYAGSVHGLARQGGNPAAPICSGCHTAHEVRPASIAMGEGLNNACTGCHAGVVDAHRTWLPNTELHFDIVSCPVCHAPGARRKVDLKLYDSTTQTRVSQQRGVPLFETRARSAVNGNGLDALAVWNLLQAFNAGGAGGKTVLQGRMEVSSGPEAHQLAAKSKAISDCKTCHRQGADAFQSVTISIAGPDGRPLRYGADKGVLNSAISLNSVGGFYAIGGTRVVLLDVLFLMALFAGIAIPAGHLTLRWLFKQQQRKNPAPPAA